MNKTHDFGLAMTKRWFVSFAIACFGLMPLGAAPDLAGAKQIAINEDTWKLLGQGASIVEHDGRPALRVNRGRASLEGIDFENGLISFDIKMKEARGFSGIYFRQNDQNSEYFYLRSHQSGNPDANQYTPVYNGISGWHLYYGERYSAPTNYTFDSWMNVVLAVKGDKMDVYIDSEEPVLHVDKLLGNFSGGNIQFGGAGQDFHISNIKVLKDDGVSLLGAAKPFKELPKGLITRFTVADKAVADAEVEAQPLLDPKHSDGLNWQQATPDESGAVNLAKYMIGDGDFNTALANVNLISDEEQIVRLHYGFSDRVTVFYEGAAIAHGNDTYQTRDYRFLGTMGLFDSVFLTLKPGKNTVTFAVTEGFGGWGLTAALDDDVTGVRVE